MQYSEASERFYGLLLLTYAQSAAGAHGAARLGPVLGDGGDADRTAESSTVVLNTDVLV